MIKTPGTKVEGFFHASDARNSDPLLRLRMNMGASGYGVYFMLLERLHQTGTPMSPADYELAAYDLRVEPDDVRAVMEDYGLFRKVMTPEGEPSYFFEETPTGHDELQQMNPLRPDEEAAPSAGNNQQTYSADSMIIAQTKGSDSVASGSSTPSGAESLGTKEKEKIPPHPPIKEKENRDGDDGNAREPSSSPPPPPDDLIFSSLGIDQRIDLARTRTEWMRVMEEKAGGADPLEKLLAEFKTHCISNGKIHTDLVDLMSHFNRWLGRRQADTNEPKQNRQNGTTSNHRNSGTGGFAAKLPPEPACGLKRRPKD